MGGQKTEKQQDLVSQTHRQICPRPLCPPPKTHTLCLNNAKPSEEERPQKFPKVLKMWHTYGLYPTERRNPRATLLGPLLSPAFLPSSMDLQWAEFIATGRNDKENSTELGREHTHGASNVLPLSPWAFSHPRKYAGLYGRRVSMSPQSGDSSPENTERLWPFQSAPICWSQGRAASTAFSIYFKDGEAEISKP